MGFLSTKRVFLLLGVAAATPGDLYDTDSESAGTLTPPQSPTKIHATAPTFQTVADTLGELQQGLTRRRDMLPENPRTAEWGYAYRYDVKNCQWKIPFALQQREEKRLQAKFPELQLVTPFYKESQLRDIIAEYGMLNQKQQELRDAEKWEEAVNNGRFRKGFRLLRDLRGATTVAEERAKTIRLLKAQVATLVRRVNLAQVAWRPVMKEKPRVQPTDEMKRDPVELDLRWANESYAAAVELAQEHEQSSYMTSPASIPHHAYPKMYTQVKNRKIEVVKSPI